MHPESQILDPNLAPCLPIFKPQFLNPSFRITPYQFLNPSFYTLQFLNLPGLVYEPYRKFLNR